MIAVLISIRPKLCEKIISGEKTTEVRKTRPKLIPPFKCYIYCTQSADMLWILKEGERSLHPDKIADVFKAAKCGGAYRGNGNVIGEFTCNRVTNLFSNSRFWLDEDDVLHTWQPKYEPWRKEMQERPVAPTNNEQTRNDEVAFETAGRTY